jgi:hypothetical protein
MNQELFAEQMWKALLGELYEGKIVSTFKDRLEIRMERSYRCINGSLIL